VKEMSVDGISYLDTSALAKWYLNEKNSDIFAEYIQGLNVAVISNLTVVEIRSLLARRRRMGDIDPGLESTLFAAFQDDISSGHLQLYSVEESYWADAANLMTLFPGHPLRTLDALHLAIVRYHGIKNLATADCVMANAATEMDITVELFAAC
jgi:predicted nucleic acid-binding protein